MGKGGLVNYVNTDFFRIIFRLEGSIFDNIAHKIFATFVISLVAALLHESSLKWFSAEGGVPPVNALAYTITGSSIAFLLVFRSVISYNRFWEGRGHLGGLMENARDFARQTAFCVRLDDGPADVDRDVVEQSRKDTQEGKRTEYGDYVDATGVREDMQRMHGFRRLQMCRQLLVFWRLMIQHVRDEHGPEYVERVLYSTVDERKKVVVTPHVEELLKKKKRRPLVAISMLSWYLQQEYKSKNITYMEYLSMDNNLTQLIAGFNGVDKVHNVPIPFPYAQMISLLMSLYCFTAPFMFVASFGWATFLPACFLTTSFFGINEVAIEIEDPFGTDENDLPLDVMGNALKDDCEMNLEVALVPKANIQQYWEEIGNSKMMWRQKHAVAIEHQVVSAPAGGAGGGQILPYQAERPKAKAADDFEPEPEPEPHT